VRHHHTQADLSPRRGGIHHRRVNLTAFLLRDLNFRPHKEGNPHVIE
jgi:hypothetical protein